MRKAIVDILYTACVINIFWVFLSACEILIKNTGINPEYSAANYFVLFLKLLG